MIGFVIIFSISLILGCANVVAPNGGEKDIAPPLLIRSKLQQNNNKLSISFEFDEYIQLNMWAENFCISPPIIGSINKSIKKKILTISIPEEVNQNETYSISLNNCIKDLNEGNVIDSLTYLFSKKDFLDSLQIRGKLQDSYTLNPIRNNWVMLFKEWINDSVLFKSTPNYVAKTDEKNSPTLQVVGQRPTKIRKVFSPIEICIRILLFQNFLVSIQYLQIQNYKLNILFQPDEKHLYILLHHYSK